MSWGYVAAAVTTVVGGVMNKNSSDKQTDAAKKAANQQREAASQASQLQRDIYDKNLQTQQPWLQSGGLAQSALAGALGLNPHYDSSQTDSSTGATGDDMNKTAMNFQGALTKQFTPSDLTTDPSYKWRLDQGEKALQASAAARGGLLTGQGLKDISDYGQNAASQEYQAAFDRYNVNQNNLYNRLAGLSGTGQVASGNTGEYGQNMANQVGGNLLNGASRGSYYDIQGANSGAAGNQNTANTISSLLGTYNQYKQNQNQANQWGSNSVLTGGGAGSHQSDYTGDAMRNWAATQPTE